LGEYVEDIKRSLCSNFGGSNRSRIQNPWIESLTVLFMFLRPIGADRPPVWSGPSAGQEADSPRVYCGLSASHVLTAFWTVHLCSLKLNCYGFLASILIQLIDLWQWEEDLGQTQDEKGKYFKEASKR
jgi:hypothetical protein